MSVLDLHLSAFEIRPRPRNRFHVWHGRIRFRQHLWRLLRDKPELLADVGFTIEHAREEVSKPFWR